MRLPRHWINWSRVVIDSPDLSFHEKAICLYLDTYMDDRNGWVYPSIDTFCTQLSMSRPTVVKYLKALEEKGWLSRQKRFGKSAGYRAEVPGFELEDSGLVDPQDEADSSQPDLLLGESHSLYYINTNNNNNVGGKNRRFFPPTPADVESYAKSIGFAIDGNQFCDFYAAKGWMIGKNKMKDWKAAVRTWKRSSASSSINDSCAYTQGMI